MIEQNIIKEQIVDTLKNDEEITILIHSDIMHGFKIPFLHRNDFLSSHLNEIKKLNNNSNIWMPAFNYDFLKSKIFDVNFSKSQVGVLSEYFRKNLSDWRSSVPVFSFSGMGNFLKNDNIIIDSFGQKSEFEYLYEKNAWLMHYGSSLSSSTILHYAERISGCLSYRYDKFFSGNIIGGDSDISHKTIKYHVRPMNNYLGYDWNKIEEHLIEEGILLKFEEDNTRILLCRVKKLVDFWVSKLKEDQFYLLDEVSKSWIIPMIDKLGRPFLITDFE